jgi:hypothetical protein
MASKWYVSIARTVKIRRALACLWFALCAFTLRLDDDLIGRYLNLAALLA